MTISHTPCPECGAKVTHVETLTELSGPRPVAMTNHICPDCGKKWTTTLKPTITK